MGLFNFLKGKTNEPEQTVAPVQNTEQTGRAVIDMSKSQESLNKVLINMSKNSKIDMSKHVARVAVAMDYSGSMSNLFANGSVQETITRLLPISLKFDDNGELECWLFSNGKERLKAVTKDNYKDYVQKGNEKSTIWEWVEQIMLPFLRK